MVHDTMWRWGRIMLCFGTMGLCMQCGTSVPTSGSSDSGADSTTEDGTDSTADDSGSDDDSNSDSNSEGFRLSGTIASGTSGSLVGGLKSVATTPTDAIAISPGVQGASCRQATVASDGTFDLTLEAGQPWMVVFIDRAQSGASMVVGRLVSDQLDALAPSSTATSLDLSTVTMDADSGTATSSRNLIDIVADLGIDSAVAELLATLDDTVTRYQNPDIDNDGAIDCSSTTSNAVPYFLDFHVRFDMSLAGSRASIADILDTFLAADQTTATYSSTGIYVAYPSSFSTETTGTVTFADAVTTEGGSLLAAGSTNAATTSLSFSDYYSFGTDIGAASELPDGEISFGVGSETLTFSGVVTPPLSELTAPTGRIFPFIRFDRTSSSCTSGCTLSGLSYEWRKKTSTGWTSASVSELATLVEANQATAGFNVGLDTNSSQTVYFTIPATAASGTITWAAANASLSGVSEAEFLVLTTEQICHLGLSFDDTLGMRYFAGYLNAPGTCE